MSFSEWIKTQIESLRAMMQADEPPAVPPDGVIEVPNEKGVLMRFLSSTANLKRVRKAIERFCEGTSLDTQARDEIGLVVNEALANVIRHADGNAQDKPIELHAERVDGGVKIQIRDWGNGEDPSKVEKSHDPLVPGGLGLLCMKRLMDDARFVPQSHGMLLELTRTSSGSKAAKLNGN